MQGIHVFDRHAKTVIDLESFVQQDHLLRKIDRVLDTGFVRELTAACYADGLGRSSIDPEVYFRMELVAYLYGIKSERQLCEDIYSAGDTRDPMELYRAFRGRDPRIAALLEKRGLTAQK